MSRIFLIEKLIKDQVKKFGGTYVVNMNEKTGDSRGSSKIRKKTIEALSQPISEKERMRMPEGDQFKEWRFYSMFGSNKVSPSNRIEDNNKLFEIKSIQDWGTAMKALGVVVE